MTKLTQLNIPALSCSYFLQTKHINRDIFMSNLLAQPDSLCIVESQLYLKQYTQTTKNVICAPKNSFSMWFTVQVVLKKNPYKI